MECPARVKSGRTSEVSELTVDPIKRIFVSLSTYRITRARVTCVHKIFARETGDVCGTGSKSLTFWCSKFDAETCLYRAADEACGVWLGFKVVREANFLRFKLGRPRYRKRMTTMMMLIGKGVKHDLCSICTLESVSRDFCEQYCASGLVARLGAVAENCESQL